MEIVSVDEQFDDLTNSSFQRETNVLPSNLSPHTRDSEVQYSRLQTTV